MDSTIQMPVILTTSVINLFNQLIKNKAINIKKLYKVDKYILENNIVDVKQMYCKHRTNKNTMCLNKCIENSKYCAIHDPIKKEEKKINRLNMNIKRKLINQEIKLFRNIEYETGEVYEPSAPSYNEINNKGIISESIDNITLPPKYEQKPDEVGKIIKNHININKNNPLFNKNVINSINNNINNIDLKCIHNVTDPFYSKVLENQMDTESILGVYNLRLLKLKHMRDDKENIQDIFKQIIPVRINKDTNEEEIIPSLYDYTKKLENIDYNIYEPYKGLQMRRLCYTIIEFQFKLYKFNKPSFGINSKTIKFINNIVKYIPK